ncbi:MAG: c-type cytochrome [Planctomycetes bacterium]|nr:c-type cytochrome [Planctomycetota bacterium]
MARWSLLAALLVAGVGLSQDRGLPPGIKDTQDPKDVPPTPAEAAKRFKVPDGFKVSLFAGEPDVCQPIAMCFDDRGRLWVAECFSYPNWTTPGEGRDRILILEDTDNAGHFDKRTVFWDRAYNLTSVAYGYGGIWALCAPHLLFLPFEKGSNKLAQPKIVLDGFSVKAGHNIVNGLLWGPDGWLYGRHGILAESKVGLPGTPDDKRARINCGIWRYHPTRKIFEVVCHGTTNPWGLDFDQHGEGFFTNSVIGHLWHMIPGARYQRMYGQDYNPHSYELMASTSDHLHWAGGDWTTSRGGRGAHSDAGGGHAHAGGLIYQGGNFPDEYRGKMLLCNIHGNRLNTNILERQGCGYVAKRAPDFLTSDNPWFRGIALATGPDGGVYVSDWCDLGECHDNDGVHRSSGRIYKITHAQPTAMDRLDLADFSPALLVNSLAHPNSWYTRHASRLASERASSKGARPGNANSEALDLLHFQLRTLFENERMQLTRLRTLWSLYRTNATSENWLLEQLADSSEHMRAWVIRFLSDATTPTAKALSKFENMAKDDSSGLVRLYLASTLQRLATKDRWLLATHLASHAEDALDRCQPLMIWYGIEPAVPENPSAALTLAVNCRMPKLRQFIARRLSADLNSKNLELLVETLADESSVKVQRDLLLGMRDGLKGQNNVGRPKNWSGCFAKLQAGVSAEVRQLSRLIGLVFDDPLALASLNKTVTDLAADSSERAAALGALAARRSPDLPPTLYKLLEDRNLRGPAMRALANFADEKTPAAILKLYVTLTGAEKQDAVGTLASRPSFALALLDAIEKKLIPRGDISAFSARQLQDLKNKEVTDKLTKVWGQLQTTSAEKKTLIAEFKAKLTPQVLANGNASAGRVVFKKLCAQCHVLYGEGQKIGPDLTGSGRADLHYVLENIIDPSAVIGRDYQLTNIVTGAGRLISGIVVEETDRSVTVQTATERLTLATSDIEERHLSKVSMMPEGLVERMSFEELRDLVRYLATKEPPYGVR